MGSILSASSKTLGEMARLCLLALVVFSVFTAHSSANSLRLKRDVCERTHQEYEDCRMSAYGVYQSAMIARPDDRPDWRARKTCNYITTAIEDCANKMIGEGYTEEEVDDIKDQEIPQMMQQLSTSVKEWNSELCPVIEDHLDGMNSIPNITDEEKEGDGETEGEKEVGGETEGETEGEEETEGEIEGEGETENNSSESSNENPESGSESPVASLCVVIVLYTICMA